MSRTSGLVASLSLLLLPLGCGAGSASVSTSTGAEATADTTDTPAAPAEKDTTVAKDASTEHASTENADSKAGGDATDPSANEQPLEPIWADNARELCAVPRLLR